MTAAVTRSVAGATLRRQISRLAAVPLVLIAALAATASPAAAVSDPAPRDPFASSSYWNAPIPSTAPLAADSASRVAGLVQQVQTYGSWINASQWSTPVYSVPGSQATVPVTVDYGTSMYTNWMDALNLSQQLSAVPIPANAQPSPDSDHHLIIWQPSTDTEWEMWLVSKTTTPAGATVWHCGWGARITSVSQSPGTVPHPFGATASGIPLLGGLMTANEIASARWGDASITHALALAVPLTEGWGQFVWPANRTDGKTASAPWTLEGTRFRLDPNLNVNALGLPPLARAMALAAQRYGIVVRDTSGSVAFYAEQPSDVGLYDYNWGSGLNPAQLLANFPWASLQVVAPPPGA